MDITAGAPQKLVRLTATRAWAPQGRRIARLLDRPDGRRSPCRPPCASSAPGLDGPRARIVAPGSLRQAECEVVSRESAEERRQRDADQKAEPGGPPE